MKIYTKTGDQGKTFLGKGKRVSKHNLLIEAVGSLDELNAWFGLLVDQDMEQSLKEFFQLVQKKIFLISAHLTDSLSVEQKAKNNITSADVADLEKLIDDLATGLKPLQNFILPGGSDSVSYCQIARAVARRAERRVVATAEEFRASKEILKYLNRLSDLLFVIARKLSQDAGVKERLWTMD